MSQTRINCLCGAINIPYDQQLPVETELCHCNPCRQTTGGLYAGFASLSGPPEGDVLARCTGYASSATHTRYFCSTCGTKLFIHARHGADGQPRDESEAWFALGGAIEPSRNAKNDVLRVDYHAWLVDTGDGGMAPFLTKLGGREITCYDTNVTQLLTSDLEKLVKGSEMELPHKQGDQLTAECRCGGVSLRVQRADHTDRTISQLDRYIPKDLSGRAENDKHIGKVCACRSCRLQMGVSLATWIYVPPVQISNLHTGRPAAQHRTDMPETVTDDPNAELTMKHYWSSKGCCRSFCRVCGAAVFYTTDERPEITNIAAGLLRAEEGVMARSWLTWERDRVVCIEEAIDPAIAEAWRDRTL